MPAAVSQRIRGVGGAPVIVGVVVSAALLLWITRGIVGDDAHITYTYSRNLADGVGFVFNPGDRTLSTTTPLTAFMMGLPSLLGVDLQFVGVVLSVVCAGAIAALLAINLRPYAPPLALAVGAVVVFLHPFSVTTVTNEMLFYTALALGAFHMIARRRYALAGLLAGLCALTRPDGGLVVVFVIAIAAGQSYANLRGGMSRRESWRPLVSSGAVASAVLLPWLAFATWYHGSPVPVTLRAKQAQRESGHGQSFVELLDARFEFYVVEGRWVVAGLIMLVGVAAGGLAAVRHRQRIAAAGRPDDGAPWPLAVFTPQAATVLLAVVWNVCVVIAYIVLDVSAYAWYTVPLVLTLAILTTLGTGWILSAVKGTSPIVRGLVSAALVVAVLAPFLVYARDYESRDAYRTVLYEPTADWIRVNVPPEASVGTLEVGLIGYFAHRTIIDFAGLLQPDAATEAQLDEGFDAIAAEAWNRYEPDFVAMLRPGIPTITGTADFESYCSLVHIVQDPSVPEVMDIYDCRARSA